MIDTALTALWIIFLVFTGGALIALVEPLFFLFMSVVIFCCVMIALIILSVFFISLVLTP